MNLGPKISMKLTITISFIANFILKIYKMQKNRAVENYGSFTHIEIEIIYNYLFILSTSNDVQQVSKLN